MDLLKGEIVPSTVRMCTQGSAHPLATREKQLAALDSTNRKLKRFALEALALSEIWPRVVSKIEQKPSSLGIAYREGRGAALVDAEEALNKLKSLRSSTEVFAAIAEASGRIFVEAVVDFFQHEAKRSNASRWLSALERANRTEWNKSMLHTYTHLLCAGIGTANSFTWRFFSATATMLEQRNELSVEKASDVARSVLPLLVQFASGIDVGNIDKVGRGLELTSQESHTSLNRCLMDELRIPHVFSAFNAEHFSLEGGQVRVSMPSMQSIGQRLDFSADNVEILGCPALHASCEGPEGRSSNVFVEYFHMLHRIYERVVIPALLSQRNSSCEHL